MTLRVRCGQPRPCVSVQAAPPARAEPMAAMAPHSDLVVAGAGTEKKKLHGRPHKDNPVPTYQLVAVGIIDSHMATNPSGAKQDRGDRAASVWQQMHLQQQQQQLMHLKRLEQNLQRAEHPLVGSSRQRAPQFMRVHGLTSNEGRTPRQERGGAAEEASGDEGSQARRQHGPLAEEEKGDEASQARRQHRPLAEEERGDEASQARRQRGPLGEMPTPDERLPTSSKTSRNARRHEGSRSERLVIRTPSAVGGHGAAGQGQGQGTSRGGRKEADGQTIRVPRLKFAKMGARDGERSLTSRGRENDPDAQSPSRVLPFITHRRGNANAAQADGVQQRQTTARASLFDGDMLDRHHALRNSNEEPDEKPLLNFQHFPQNSQWCSRGADQAYADSKAVYMESKTLSLRELAERRREVWALGPSRACTKLMCLSTFPSRLPQMLTSAPLILLSSLMLLPPPPAAEHPTADSAHDAICLTSQGQ